MEPAPSKKVVLAQEPVVAAEKLGEEFVASELVEPEQTMKATMSNNRFKQFFNFRRLQKELENTEDELKDIALRLAQARDEKWQLLDKHDKMKAEIVILNRKTEKDEKQIAQELKDREIIIADLQRLYKQRENIT